MSTPNSPGSPRSTSDGVHRSSMNDLTSHKMKKYDRQLRLWGDHGQTALERSNVCLIGATATGSEVLKNLILPGIGSFCIVDPEVVKAIDLGNNFFVTAQDLGLPRAEVVTRLLLEMNADVKGDYVVESLESLLQQRPCWLKTFSVVVAADIPSEKLLVQLSEFLYTSGIPLLICRSYGMIGYVRVCVKEHHITDARAENFVDDLRLENPFPELSDLADTVYLHHLSKQDHGHVPYVLLLLKVLFEYRKTHGGNVPNTYKEKTKFREMVAHHQWKKEDGKLEKEENFQEACKAVVKVLGKEKIPINVQQLFDDPACENINIHSETFWIIIRAIREFVLTDGHGYLPHSGSLPDMTSDTDSFIKLQKAYLAKAERDCQSVFQKVSHFCGYIGKPDFIKLSQVREYCRNSAFLGCLRISTLKAEYEDKAGISSILDHGDEQNFNGVMWYLMLRSSGVFYQEIGRLPGIDAASAETDVHHLKSYVLKLAKAALASTEFISILTDENLEKYCKEITRFGGEQVHSVAAFMGGVVGHEVIKLLTHQYIPINSTLIYDASKCSTETFLL